MDDGVAGVGEALCPVETLRTITHEPTVTSLRLARRSAVNFVALVKVTAVCIPLPCTCRVWPSTAATSPLTPGKRPCPVSPWPFPAAEVGDVVLADGRAGGAAAGSARGQHDDAGETEG